MNDTEGVLVSPLGLSPGAVSGVYFKLAERFNIRKVITLGTSDPNVISAANQYLTPLFAHQGIEYEPVHIPEHELRGGDRVVTPYVALWGLILETARQQGQHIHVSVTAGRSGMGALAALAASLYGADYLWHFWVREDIERQGALSQGILRPSVPSRMAQNPLLNPTVEPNACDIVALPFTNLRPLHPLIWQYRWTGALPDVPGLHLDALLAWIKTDDFDHIFPAGITFAAARQIVDYQQQYNEATPAERSQYTDQLGDLLQQRGVVNNVEREQLVSLLATNGNYAALLALAKQAKDYTGFWQWMLDNQERITAWTQPDPPEGIPGILLNRLRTALIRSEKFESNRSLKALFVDGRIITWRSGLRQPDSTEDRVMQVIDYLHQRFNSRGENALVLFLHVLKEQLPPEDAGYRELDELIGSLEPVLQPRITATALPPEAPCASWFWTALHLYLRVNGRLDT